LQPAHASLHIISPGYRGSTEKEKLLLRKREMREDKAKEELENTRSFRQHHLIRQQ
jgi:hypothetical protein